MSAHLDRLGVRSEDRGDYIEHLLRARVELRRAMNLEGPSAGHADPPSEACHAASRLSVALDRLGCPPTMGVADYLLREGRDRYESLRERVGEEATQGATPEDGEQGRVVLVRAIGEKEPTYTGDWFLPVGDPESFRNYRHDSFRYEVKTFVPESDQQAEREMCTTHPDRPANAFTAYCSECWQRERNQQVERGLREALVEIERENTSRVYSVAGWVPRWAKNLLIARWTRDRARAALASTPPESEQRCTGLPCSSCGCTDPNCPVHGGESEQEEPRGDG